MDSLIISKVQVRSNAFVDDNVKDKSIITAIQLAQQISLQNLIGTKMYAYILSEGSAISTDYKTLITSKIIPLLEWYTVYNLINIKSAGITSSGVTKEDRDNSVALEISELNRLGNITKGYVTSFETLLINYIEGNASLYPEYFEYSSTGVTGTGEEELNIIFDYESLEDHSLSYYKNHAFGF